MSYKDKNKEKENKRIYYLRNREKLLKRARDWNLAHPERVKEIRKNYLDKMTKLH